MNSKIKTITLFFFIVFAVTLTSYAQITKGNWLVGGDGNYSSIRYESETNGTTMESDASSIRINPNLGYFFIDKFAGGMQVQLTFLEPGSSSSFNSYSFGPFVRYYFLNQENRINIFSQINYDFGFGKNGLDVKSNSNGYGIKAGTVLFFNRSVGIELSLNYINSTTKQDGGSENASNAFLVGLGFQIHLEK
ncbi:MAG: hypothetical protein ACSHXF_01445 [Aquaticitalea sp.]